MDDTRPREELPPSVHTAVRAFRYVWPEYDTYLEGGFSWAYLTPRERAKFEARINTYLSVPGFKACLQRVIPEGSRHSRIALTIRSNKGVYLW